MLCTTEPYSADTDTVLASLGHIHVAAPEA
jgi:hypothetical protein